MSYLSIPYDVDVKLSYAAFEIFVLPDDANIYRWAEQNDLSR